MTKYWLLFQYVVDGSQYSGILNVLTALRVSRSEITQAVEAFYRGEPVEIITVTTPKEYARALSLKGPGLGWELLAYE